jgi:hypothetical protein
MESVENPVNLPAVVLDATDLKKLEVRLNNILCFPSIAITVSREGINHTYESFSSMVSDNLSPRIVRRFEIRFNSAGGKGRIAADSTESDKHLLYIDGYSEWRDHICTEIIDFIAEREASLRSILSGKYRMAPISAISTILVGQFYTTLSPFGIFYPAPRNIPIIVLFLLISTLLFFSSTFRSYFFPYVYWDISDKNNGDLYLKSTLEILGLTVLLIMSVVILNFVFEGSAPF